MTFALTAVVKSNGREIEFRGLFFGARTVAQNEFLISLHTFISYKLNS
jgi:hypothetical protein